MLAAFMPLVAASIFVYKEEGIIGTNKLFKRILDFSRITKKRWYVPIILLPFLMYLLIYILIHLIGLPLPIKFDIPFFFGLFFFGAVAEETGYMGYAID